MDYDIVHVAAKSMAGVRARTKNSDPEMVTTIAKLWQHFTFEGVHLTIPHQVDVTLYSLYTNYESDETGEYDVIAACEVSAVNDMPDGVVTLTIPAGSYARFTVTGQEEDAVFQCWQQIWKMPLNRKYSCDFELYTMHADSSEKKVEIYIALKDPQSTS